MNRYKIKQFLTDQILLPLVGFVLCLIAWTSLSYLTFDSSAQVSDFPSPVTTWRESSKYFAAPFSHNEEEGFDGIGIETWRSLKLVAWGYGLAILVAVPLGFLLGASHRFARMFDPIFQVLRPISPLAWFPLAGLIVVAIRRHNEEIDATQLQCIFTIAMCSLWPTVVNTAVGVRAIPQDYINVARVLRLSSRKLFTRILLPATLPQMFTGFRLSLGIAWLVIVAAEMLSGKNGIGAFVNNQYQSGTYGPMIAAVMLIGVVGFMLDRLMTLCEKNAHAIIAFAIHSQRRIIQALSVRKSAQASSPTALGIPVPTRSQEASHATS